MMDLRGEGEGFDLEREREKRDGFHRPRPDLIKNKDEAGGRRNEQ